jgi:glycosyltransferase involved in cell wall biosynthesis
MGSACRLHLTNVSGLGASRLVGSLLDAIDRQSRYSVERVYLPDRGPLAAFQSRRRETRVEHYRRRLPNALSRLLECTIGASHFDSNSPLLVLGDLPLRVGCRQSVFVQQRFLVDDDPSSSPAFAIKVAMLRRVFAANLRFASALVVQSDLMKEALLERYSIEGARIRVIPQPAPTEVIESGLRRTGRRRKAGEGMTLFYPAAPFPHKNQRLLADIPVANDGWGVSRLTLSLPRDANPNPSVRWIDCVGTMAGQEVLAAYSDADALLFLSTRESYGVPLVEAMAIGLPIVCADLPYARHLCGETAIYFSPADAESLRRAIAELRSRLDSGWWPDWSRQLRRIPSDWDMVAEAMLSTLFTEAAWPRRR